MFMDPNGGMSLTPLIGRWLVHNQPKNWNDTDSKLFGNYNRNISISMNVPAGTTYSVTMKAGEEVIFEGGGNTNFGFESYPAQWSNGYEVTPSGIDSRLVGLQFAETSLPVREKEYYEKKSKITVEITFEQQGKKLMKSYELQLSWDDYYSSKPNPLINDLQIQGLPFVAQHKSWIGRNSVTGEYIYEQADPIKARVDINGYWVGCFWLQGEAMLDFPAFEATTGGNGLRITGKNSVGISLDLCTAGMDLGSADISAWLSVETKSGFRYYLLRTAAGTFIAQHPDFRPWHVYFVQTDISGPVLTNLLADGKELWVHHDFKNDPLGHQRLKLGSMSFWNVLKVDHPAPALGGTSGGSLPTSFHTGIMSFIAKYPLWYTRLGSLPSVS